MKTILWNGDQRRLRTLWRLIGQLLILGVIVFILGGAIGCLATALLTTQGAISSDGLSDPGTVQQSLMANPLLLMLGSLTSGLALTISIWLAGRLLDRRRFAGFGLHLDRDWRGDFGFGLALGAALMLSIFLVELAAGWLTVAGTFATRNSHASFLPAILVPLVTFLAVGFYEELYFRGYQLKNLAEGLNWSGVNAQAAITIATLISSTAFGAVHALNANASLLSTLNIAAAGILLATGYLLTGELAIPIALHISWNFFQGNVFGFPVSGTDFSSATFISIQQGGPELWTGGPFGPEGGLLGLAAMLAGIFLIVLRVRRRHGHAGLDSRLAEAPARHVETA